MTLAEWAWFLIGLSTGALAMAITATLVLIDRPKTDAELIARAEAVRAEWLRRERV